MVLPDGRVESCGNFHGAPVGFAADFLAIALTELGAIAERRMDRLLDVARNQGLPPFLADEPGVDSGLMIGHYTAAAIASENKRLAAPASVDSLPTSAMQEDHVSMAWSAARKLRRVVDNVRRILAVEYVIAARAVELRRSLEPAQGTGALIKLLRQHVAGPGPDRYVSPELRDAGESPARRRNGARASRSRTPPRLKAVGRRGRPGACSAVAKVWANDYHRVTEERR